MAASGAGPRTWATPSTRPDADSYYRLAPDGTYAYLSSYRIGGYGEKDIYTISYIKNITVKGTVFSKRDSTQTIPGVELVFNGTQADKTAISFRDVTKDPGGDYQVKVLSARTYQVAVNKDGKNIETQEFAVPISLNDSTSITKNFYVDYIDTTALANSRFAKIYFDTDKYTLRPESIVALKNTASILKANTGINISIEGNCDSRNTDEYNMVLGQNRADAAKNYLVKQGGSQRPPHYGELRRTPPRRPQRLAPENMQLNRRDEFRVVLKEGEKMPMIQPATTTTTTTIIAVPVSTAPPLPGKSKVRMADGTKVKTKVDEDSDKVKVKTKGADGSKSKTVSKEGELDSKAKDAEGQKAKVKVKPE